MTSAASRSSASCSRGGARAEELLEGERRLADQHRQAVDHAAGRACARSREQARFRAAHRPCRTRSRPPIRRGRQTAAACAGEPSMPSGRGIDQQARRSRQASARHRRASTLADSDSRASSAAPFARIAQRSVELEARAASVEAANGRPRRAAGADHGRPARPCRSVQRSGSSKPGDVGVRADQPAILARTTQFTAPIRPHIARASSSSGDHRLLVRHGDVAAAPVRIARGAARDRPPSSSAPTRVAR